jgi:hypothetical protein
VVEQYEQVETLEVAVHDLRIPCVEIVDGLNHLPNEIERFVPFPVDVLPLENVEQAAQFTKLQGYTEPWSHAHAVEAHNAWTLHHAVQKIKIII